MKALMYHYVRPTPEGLPYFRFLHINDFRRQLDELTRTYRFPARDSFLGYLESGTAPKDAVVLTFDDGFSDHFDFVVPELERRGLWGIFYVPTGIYQTRRLLDVHRIHLLLGKHGGVALLGALEDIIEPRMLDEQDPEEFRTHTYMARDDDAATIQFKRTLNYFVSHRWRKKILDQLMGAFFPSESDLVNNYYLSPSQIRIMHDAGMIVGSHGVSHRVFSKLTASEQHREIRDSFAFLENVSGGLAIRTFCYPYGGFHSFTVETEAMLTDLGCRFSFNVEPRDITSRDLVTRPQALPRYDCNLFYHGTARKGAAQGGVTVRPKSHGIHVRRS